MRTLLLLAVVLLGAGCASKPLTPEEQAAKAERQARARRVAEALDDMANSLSPKKKRIRCRKNLSLPGEIDATCTEQ
jgi:hypothetical protein